MAMRSYWRKDVKVVIENLQKYLGTVIKYFNKTVKENFENEVVKFVVKVRHSKLAIH